MKHFAATSAILAALTLPAFADGHAQIQSELDAMGIEADASKLSQSELAQLEFLLNGSTTSPAAKQGRIELILEGADAMKMSSADGRYMIELSPNSLRNQVANTLEGSGVQCDVYALPEDKVAEIYVAVTSSMSSGDAIDAAKAACI